MKKQKPRKQIKEESYTIGFNEGYAEGRKDERGRMKKELESWKETVGKRLVEFLRMI
jgi:flagellar biosynthesis/type III secretory pathway protein FliH